MRIIYGGSFNPPTIAHKRMYYYLDDKLSFDEFIYLPVSTKYSKANLASNEHRFNMLKILTKDMEKAIVSPDEFNDPNYLGTYHYLKTQKEDTLFVMGSDNLKTIRTWINYEKLLEEFKFIIIERDEDNLIELIDSDELLKKNKDNFIIFNDFDMKVSSSAYRNDKDESVLTEEVLDYIKKNHLYGG